jgi:hypothetical protein
MAQLINRRSNRAALRATILVGNTSADAIINFTDSKQFNWTGAAPTDSGKDISKFFKKFAIQLITVAAGKDFNLEANIAGEWVSCPVGLISSTNMASGLPIATLRQANNDIITVSLPVHGIQLRLVSAADPVPATNQAITILMSDSSERADVGRA